MHAKQLMELIFSRSRRISNRSKLICLRCMKRGSQLFSQQANTSKARLRERSKNSPLRWKKPWTFRLSREIPRRLRIRIASNVKWKRSDKFRRGACRNIKSWRRILSGRRRIRIGVRRRKELLIYLKSSALLLRLTII